MNISKTGKVWSIKQYEELLNDKSDNLIINLRYSNKLKTGIETLEKVADLKKWQGHEKFESIYLEM